MNAASDVVTNVQDGVKNAEDLLKNEVGLFKDCVVSNLSSLMDTKIRIFLPKLGVIHNLRGRVFTKCQRRGVGAGVHTMHTVTILKSGSQNTFKDIRNIIY